MSEPMTTDAPLTSAPLSSREILENLATAIILFDREQHIQYMNPAAEALFTVSARKMLGRDIGSVLRCSGGAIQEHLEAALKTSQPLTEREIVLRLADGREVTVDCTMLPLTDSEGKPATLIEIQQVDRHVRISREEQLMSQHQATWELIRGLAHEIKNPLGGLRGAAQLLEGELDDEGLKEYTRVIIDEADRLQALVDRMLGPSRVAPSQQINIHQVLERVRSLVQAEAGERITITRDYDPSIPELSADPDQLIQAVLNLVRNAARALGESGGQITLRSRVQRQFTIGNASHRLVAQLDVIDNGPGIPAAIQEKIFFPMVSGESGGTGLGLTIAQSLIARHGGLIECHSRPGETVFTVYLPLERTA